MKEKLQAGLDKVKQLYTGEKKSRNIKLTVLAVAVVLIAVIVAAVLTLNRPYQTLVTGLTTDEVSAIVGKLQEYGASDYRIEGDSIVVPEQEVSVLQGRLAIDGYPKSGFMHDTYFDNIGMMSSESDRVTLAKYDTENTMAAVIRTFTGVRDARVTITPATDERYVLNSDRATPAQAAVHVIMMDGGTLPEAYVEAIGNYVAHSVKGLTFENVSITDSAGGTYYPGTADDSSATASDLKMRLESQVNNRVRNEVLQALAPVYGRENVVVSVNSTVDTSRSVTESTTYESPDGAPDDRGLMYTRVYDQSLTRGEEETAGGVVGTPTNADIPTYMEEEGAVNGNETSITNAGTEDYALNTTTEQRERSYGIVTDVMIAVTINQNVAGNVGTAQLIGHIARAAGINVEQQADMISVLVAPFSTVDLTEGEVPEGITLTRTTIYIGAGVLGLLLVLIILGLIARRRRKKEQELLEAEEAAAAEMEAAAAMAMEMSPAETVLDIQNEKNMELKQDLRKFTEENPEIAAQMIRNWLRGGNTDG